MKTKLTATFLVLMALSGHIALAAPSVTVCDCTDNLGDDLGQVVSTDGDLGDQCTQLVADTYGADEAGDGILQDCQVTTSDDDDDFVPRRTNKTLVVRRPVATAAAATE